MRKPSPPATAHAAQAKLRLVMSWLPRLFVLYLCALPRLSSMAWAVPPPAMAAAGHDPAPADMALENDPDGADCPPPVPALPPRLAGSADYAACMDRLSDDPSGALVSADRLATKGEAAQAQHCRALAEVELGNPAKGAALLDSLAQERSLPAPSRAEIFGEAANAWDMADEAGRAQGDAASAVALAPDDADLALGFAIASDEVNDLGHARAALDRILAADPARNDARILRARVAREQGDFDQSARDVAAAIKADPDDPGALLEQGILYQRQGKLDAARETWEKIIANDEDSDDADQAAQYLALLDAG